jgi:hypothetical protein
MKTIALLAAVVTLFFAGFMTACITVVPVNYVSITPAAHPAPSVSASPFGKM